MIRISHYPEFTNFDIIWIFSPISLTPGVVHQSYRRVGGEFSHLRVCGTAGVRLRERFGAACRQGGGGAHGQ